MKNQPKVSVGRKVSRYSVLLICFALVLGGLQTFLILRSTAAPSEGGAVSNTSSPKSENYVVANRPSQEPQVNPASVDQLSPEVLQQLEALIREKSQRTPAQRKIDSNLLTEMKMHRGDSIAEGVPTLQTNVKVDSDGSVEVEIRTKNTVSVSGQLTQLSSTVIEQSDKYDRVRARLPLESLEKLAESPDVISINRPAEATTNRASSGTAENKFNQNIFSNEYRGTTVLEDRTWVRSSLPALLSQVESARDGLDDGVNTGTVTSQGDKTHQADLARTTYGVNGTGVKIGVLSRDVANLTASQASGNLPANVTVLPGQGGDTGGTGEGTAMMEIIYDLAPGAQLYFATAATSEASFAQNILDLRAAGCDIIVDDVVYVDESPFQDGIVAQAVNTVAADGALYFSAAGNGGNLTDGTSSVWEGDFANGGTITVDGRQVTAHTFGSSVYNTLTSGGGNSVGAFLFWSDPLGLSANDYDVYVLDSTGTTVFSRSDNSQTGSQDPYEFLGPVNNGSKIVILQTTGATRFLHLGAIALDSSTSPILSATTSGAEFGHTAANDCISVAAVPSASPFLRTIGTGVNPAGPFPNPFTSANHVERFSSDGPRRVFFNADGTTITPGNVSSTGGALRQKPDIAAADGVSTSLPPNSGLNPFFGTSAAAPHAAAIAALLKSFAPSISPAEIRSVLKTSAIDIEAAGIDRDSGSGIVMAMPALQSVATGVNLSSSSGIQSVTQGQDAVYPITINRRNFSGNVNLAISGLPAGASASFNPASTTGNISTLTITTNSATAAGTFTPSVTATANGATIFPLNLGLTVTPSCSYSISPSARNFDTSAATGSITVSSASGCVWTATATEPWITINSGSPGNGGGTINYSVASNSGGARTGRILIANQTFVVTQAGNNPMPGNWTPAAKMSVARSAYSITLLQNGKVLVVGGTVQNTSTTLASAELYDPSTGTWSNTGSLSTTRYSHRSVLLQNGKVLVLGGYVGSPGTATQSAETYDPVTGTWTGTGSMTAYHSGGSATLLPNGKVLIAGGTDSNGVVSSKAEIYDPVTGTFSATGNMSFASEFHVAVLLQNGKVLTVGGSISNLNVTAGAQVYDPASGTWATTDNMSNSRRLHSATLLANGKVLAAGGESNTGIQSSVDIYDPLTGMWSKASPMLDAIEDFTMTLLPNGMVLVTGGNGDFNGPASAEIFDPVTGNWHFTGNMSAGRIGHSAVLLPNGNVLVVGGLDRYITTTDFASADIFNPGFTGNWSLTGSMINSRWDHTANLLNNGNVLVAGGSGPNGILGYAELYDYTTGLWRNTGSLAIPRRNHTATMLTNGKILVVGGNAGIQTLKSSELYDPNSGMWTTTGDMSLARSSHGATLMADGRVLVTGGNSPIAPTNTTEIYDPATGLWTPAPNMTNPRSAHTATLLPSGTVLVVGANDYSLTTGETFDPYRGQWTTLYNSFSPRYGHAANLLLDGSVLICGGTYTGSSVQVFTPPDSVSTRSSMKSGHFFHTATLLQDGRVFVAGGDDGGGGPGIRVSELYERQSNSWSRTTDLIAGRELHTGTLLPNGKVLVTGGVGSSGALSSSEIYDPSPGCSYTLSQNSQNIPAPGGTGSLNMTAGTGCIWSAVSNSSYITVTAGATGVGNGTVNFTVAASNFGNPRTGTISIGDKLFTITQAAGVTCTYSISPLSKQLSGFGGSRSFNITTNASDCVWTATPDSNWLTITPPASFAGSSTIVYTFPANPGPIRTGKIMLGGQTHTVSQEAGCSVTPITPGLVVNGTLSTTDCHTHLSVFGFAYADRYSFSGIAGQQFFISQTAPTSAIPFISLLKPDGTTAAQGYQNMDNFNARIPTSGFFTLPVSGTYIIEASSVFDGSTGPYSLTLSAVRRTLFDFDGDGKSDVSVFRPSNSLWYLNRSQAGFAAFQFGAPGDLLTPADFTGDGKTDVSVFRPSTGAWYVLRSEDGTFYATGFGQNGDIPVPGDYDGDGKADVAAYRPGQGTWFLQQSTAGFSARQFGIAEDKPAVGDFDGDGKNDIAVYRPSNNYWYRLNSSNGSFFAIQFGAAGDKIVPADYTGDGKTDIAVWRPSSGTWYVLRSEDLSFYGAGFGTNGDLPAPGDYDGDGKADIAVYRPSQGTWYMMQSTSGFNAVQFGIAEDKPTPSAFVY